MSRPPTCGPGMPSPLGPNGPSDPVLPLVPWREEEGPRQILELQVLSEIVH